LAAWEPLEETQMKLLRTLAFLLCFFGLGAAAQAQTQCVSSGTGPLVVTYPNGGGSISINYQVCFDAANPSSSFTWNGTVTYNNVDWGNGFSVNGTMNMVLTYSNNSFSSIALNGGPLNYVVGGQPHVVTFNNLTFNFGSGFQVTSASGGLTIDGGSVPVQNGYWGYLFH
jgi:hypothetical protein